MSRSARARSAPVAFAVILTVWAGSTPASADAPRATGAVDGGDPRVEVTLVTSVTEVAPGTTFDAGLRFRLDPGWHVYWKNPGDGAMATEVTWEAEGAGVGPTRWPVPERFEEAGFIVTYGYAGEVILPVAVRVPAEAPAGATAVTLRATADFLVCEEECIPDRLTVSGRVPLAGVGVDATGDGVALPEEADAIDRWLTRIPKTPSEAGVAVETGLSQAPIRPGDAFEVAVALTPCPERPDRCGALHPPEAGVESAFFPERIPGVKVRPSEVRPHPAGGGAVLVLSAEAGPDAAAHDAPLRGVVHMRNDAGEEMRLDVEVPLPRAPAGAAVATTPSPLLGRDGLAAAADPAPPSTPKPASLPLAYVLLLALLGGVVLNLMPCVLPVLALKAFGLTRLAEEAGNRPLLHALAYAGGILASMLALAAVVVLLQAGGTALGWGFQFQEPLFVAVLAALLVVFALRLFGVFEIGFGAGGLAAAVDERRGLARSGAEGVLAVVLATPCSAPFLGTAVGFAFASEAPVVFAVFAAVGLGLAAPFVLLVLVPGSRRLLPKPGPWMARLEVLLGFALLGTVVWLAWVLGQGVGTDGVAKLLAFLLAVALGTWLLATVGRNSRRGRLVAAVSALVLVGATAFVTLRFDRARASTAQAEGAAVAWAPWSEEAVETAVTAGQVVFVDFTADWCITCKANETLVLERDPVASALESESVVTLKADWTRRDERIRAELARHGKAGVPLYLVIDPRNPSRPEVLPEVLTAERVLEALRRARGEDDSAS